MIALLRTLVFTLVFYVGSVPLILWGAFISAFWRPWLFALADVWSQWFVWCAKVFIGVRLVIEGEVPSGRVLVAMKHQAGYEAMLTLSLFWRPAVVMKASLEHIPVWGFVARQHGSIFVDRSGSASTLRTMLRAGQAATAEGRLVVIFPEGTRVPVGSEPPLAAGFAGLYKLLKLPVVPAALDTGRIWPRGFVKHAGVVTIRFFDAIPPGLPRGEIEVLVHAAINRDPVNG